MIKYSLTLLLATMIAIGARAQQAAATAAWNEVYPMIEANIKAPVFADKDYVITDFGAKANDTTVLNTEPINRAIAVCSSNGGGRVVVPAGTWFTAPITMKSNVNLHISEGATLLFTTDVNYFPNVLTRWEGLDCYNHQPLLYAYGETNIAVTGKGTIDGGASVPNWWRQCGSKKYGWEEGVISQRVGRPKLLHWAEDKKPISERVFTHEDGMRPQTLNFYLCNNVLIEDVTMLRSPFWVIHPVLCNNVTVRGVKVINRSPNGDGCDPESCNNVLIEDCLFDVGDDCIAIKSGRNNDGRFWNTPSQNMIVRNCFMKNGHGGVVVGSEITGGYKNLFVENCKMDSPDLDRVIRIKTNNIRGGVVENIFVRNVEVGQCREAVLKINLIYEQKEIGLRNFDPTVRNVYLENVNCSKSRYGVFIDAYEDKTNVSNINVSNCKFTGVSEEKINLLKGKIDGLNFTELYINDKKVKSPKLKK